MALPEDVVRWVNRHFSGGDTKAALVMLESAVDHTGEIAGPRLVRCAAVGSRGDLARLSLLLADLRIDWRDVIEGSEYEMRNGELVQVHDFDQPIVDV